MITWWKELACKESREWEYFY